MILTVPALHVMIERLKLSRKHTKTRKVRRLEPLKRFCINIAMLLSSDTKSFISVIRNCPIT